MGSIRTIHPKSNEFRPYWIEQTIRCIEGYWRNGYWMPGPLYFYVNFWHIKIKESRHSKNERVAKPFLRDIDWIKGYIYMEAKGFSGFAEDDKYTCHRKVRDLIERYPDWEFSKDNLPDDIDVEWLTEDCYDANGNFKEYVEARDYLPRQHASHLGLALYQNEAKNVIDIECRGSGKSYWAAGGLIGHNFLFDGATSYAEYVDSRKSDSPIASETLVGAIDSSYSQDLLEKFEIGLKYLEGGIEAEKSYPPPFQKKVTGSLLPSKKLRARYKKKVGNSFKWKGTDSKLHHRSFKDNPTAGNGTRPNLTILEEVGFQGNLTASLGALRLCTMNGPNKFGVIYMFGTGGEMSAEVIQEVRKVFFNPDAYDCLVFANEKGGTRGFFVSYQYGLNDYKDEEGNTDLEKADIFIERERATAKAMPDKQQYNALIQNNPIHPEEAFLVSSGNIFPIAELTEHLNKIENNPHPIVRGHLGTIVEDHTERYGVRFVKDIDNKLQTAGYPVGTGDQAKGCVQLWELPPTGEIPYGMYFAGTDPYDQDRAPNSNSLGSTFVYKKGDFREGGLNDMIVAEYTGRPATAEEHHETVRRLLMLYNAETLYENERNTMKFHFKQKSCLRLLAKQPHILKATENSKVERMYGTHMTKQIKEELELYLRDWLLEEAGEGLKNYHRIYSVGLLKELIDYHEKGNFDRIIAMLLVIYKRLANHKVKVQEKRKVIEFDPFFNEKIYT